MSLAAILCVVGGLSLIGLSVRKNVTLTDNGQTQTLETYALTAGGVLKDAGLQLYPGDQVIPQALHWLRDGDRLTILRATQYLVQADGKTRLLVTTEQRPANLLHQLGILLFPGDTLTADGLPVAPDDPLSLQPVHSLQLRRAFRISITVDQPDKNSKKVNRQENHFFSSASTLGDALWDGGFRLYNQDQVEPDLETALGGPQKATLLPSQSLAIHYKGGEFAIRSSAATVGAALISAGLPLEGLDYSDPNQAESLPVSGEIRIVRVQENVILEQEPIPFENQYQPDPDLDLDTQVVVQPGIPGIETRRIRVRFENGREASRQVEAEFVSLPPQAQIIGYGTKVSLQTLNTPNGPIKYWRSMTVYATSYSPCRIFKDHCDSGTASGATLQKGIAAVTGEWYRYLGGTKIYVPGYGIATIADVGGGIPGQAWIDLGYSDNDYISWHQTVTVYFLAPAPAEIPLIFK